MAIPKVFAPIKPQDFTLNTIITNKRFIIDSASFATTQSGYFKWDSIYSGVIPAFGTTKVLNDPTNSIDNSNQYVIWKALDAQYYRFPYDHTSTLEHSNKRFTQKILLHSASILQLPYLDYGESIKPGSVEITNSFHNIILTDDQNGNLYDVNIDTGSFTSKHNLVGYWGFDNEFRKFKTLKYQTHDYLGLNNQIDANILTNIQYHSSVFEPDQLAIANNVRLAEGLHINDTGSAFSGYFDGYSYLLTPNRNEFNFATTDDFTISFWTKGISIAQNNTDVDYNQLISKKGVIWKQTYGKQKKYQNDIVVEVDHVSSSFWNESTNVYPYDFRLFNDASPNNSKIEFRRSDGINICSLTGSKPGGAAWCHVSVTKSGSLLTMYLNGTVVDQKTDNTKNPVNKHSIMFGSDNMNFSAGYTGYMDEIRFYDKAFSQSTIQTLANNTNQSCYQTAVVGNVFYRRGKLVISALDHRYYNIFDKNWVLKYRGTHTIFQYECLIRIKKGSFNLSQNPTTLLNPYSDLIINEMTGSQSDTGAMLPYCTSIGLYNDKKELMAVAKLSQPLQMREDVDLNIAIRWDV